ncbi:MAG: hypothetical protein AAGH64_06825 [Planctomycetota bacterium]
MRPYIITGCVLTSCVASSLSASPITVSRGEPSMDRWMYPFNFTPGTRTSASVFAAIGFEDFDERDAQYLIGFDVSPEVAGASCPAEELVVTSAVVTVTNNNGDFWVYDPTQDPVESYFLDGQPGEIADTDPGRPVMIFGADFRNGFTQQSFLQTSPFGAVSRHTRNVFNIDFDENGDPRDVSNNVSGQVDTDETGPVFNPSRMIPDGLGGMIETNSYDPNPFAIGTFDAVSPGTFVPVNETMMFDIDVSDPSIQAYLQQALVSGDLRFVVSSLQFASFDGSTGTGAFASFYTENDVFGIYATLTLTAECAVMSLCAGDFDMDGDVDLGDFGTFGAAFGSMTGDVNYDAGADFDNDGDVDLGDFGTFGAEFGRNDC